MVLPEISNGCEFQEDKYHKMTAITSDLKINSQGIISNAIKTSSLEWFHFD